VEFGCDRLPGRGHATSSKRLRTSGACESAVQNDLFEFSFYKPSFGVVFNLSVMERFTDDEVLVAFSEIERVLEPMGSAVLC